MREFSVDDARANLSEIIEEVTVSQEPVMIRGRERNAVLVGEGAWISITETLNLLSLPGMRESLAKGMGECIADCATELDW